MSGLLNQKIDSLLLYYSIYSKNITMELNPIPDPENNPEIDKESSEISIDLENVEPIKKSLVNRP